MKDKRQENQFSDPWNQDIYQTGAIEKPKKRKGMVTILLIAIIILAGISSILGLMNFQLFSQLNDRNGKGTSLSLLPGTHTTRPSTTPSQPIQSDVSIELNKFPSNSDNIPQSNGLSLQEVYTKCIDSVVSITCQNSGAPSSGTGVVISKDGYIVTNHHVIESANTINILLNDSRILTAKLIGYDTASDLAVLQVKADNLTPAEFGDSDDLRVGDVVCAIGDPLGTELRGTMTDGIVSAINRNITTGGRSMTLIQTNAALNDGNSGGPLINCYGQVIGINTMKIGDYMSNAGVEGLGFAIPSTTVKSIVEQLISQGFVSGRPTLGITGEAVPPLYQHYYDLPDGLLITHVNPCGTADAKGYRTGDILISLGGKNVCSMDDVNAVLNKYEIGDTIETVMYRNNQYYNIILVVEEATG